jgi:NADPH:quinone reductase-like Zn-dependent oxidoreductase
MKYKNVILTKRGGPEVLQIAECELYPPENNQVQIKILACGLGRTDVAMRYGYYPFAPKIPFVPGYEIIGQVKSLGRKVTKFSIGDIVASLTVHGGYSEYIFLDQEHLVKVPDGLDYGEAVSLILNYTTAYQMLKRIANVRQGNRILITGASGGVGTALLDLGKLEGLKMYGTASKQKHETIRKYGAFSIDYKSQDFVEFMNEREPGGLDVVFDGIAGANIGKSFSLLRKGGRLVEYGYPNFSGMLQGVFKVMLLNSIPNGRKAESYGISGSYKKNRAIILEDLATLFNLLKEKKIKPMISRRMPLLDASEANRILESGSVTGKIVLMTPELLT